MKRRIRRAKRQISATSGMPPPHPWRHRFHAGMTDRKQFCRDFVQPSAAAQDLGLPERWLNDEIRAGRLPALPIGRRVFVHLPSVRAILVDRAGGRAEAEAEAVAHG